MKKKFRVCTDAGEVLHECVFSENAFAYLREYAHYVGAIEVEDMFMGTAYLTRTKKPVYLFVSQV